MELLEHAKLKSSYFMHIHCNFIMKRLFDIFVSFLLLFILSPLFLGIAYQLYKREGRPIFYKEPRVGKNKRLFTMYTFRIKTPPRQLIKALPPHPKPDNWQYGVPNTFHLSRDQTFYTSTGLALKKYYLHKLPQLFNILKGDMSLVGPRPEDPEVAEHYNRQQANRLKVRPGMTGYTQLNVSETSGYDEIIKADLYYISHLSFLFDFKLLCRSLQRRNL